MSRKGRVFIHDIPVGMISEDTDGYSFVYFEEYLNLKDAKPVSFTLPLTQNSFTSKIMFPFFDGLIPEGWLLDIAYKTWKIDPRDRMGFLLTCCKDCIGAVSIVPLKDE